MAKNKEEPTENKKAELEEISEGMAQNKYRIHSEKLAKGNSYIGKGLAL